MNTVIKSLYRDMEAYSGKEVTVSGWVRTVRASNAFGFIELNDGSFFSSIQVVIEADKLSNYGDVAKLNVGASLTVKGILELTPGAKQPMEIKATEIVIEGASTPDYPLQKKRHSLEFLRTISNPIFIKYIKMFRKIICE